MEQDDVILVVTSVEAVHAKAPSQYVLLQFGPVSLRAQAKHKRLGASASESEETTGQGPEPHNMTVIHLGEILWALLHLLIRTTYNMVLTGRFFSVTHRNCKA